jgi:penicillin amidase
VECLQSFTDGVNYFILSENKKFPQEFRILSYQPELWRLDDIASIIGVIGWGLASHNLDIELFTGKTFNKLGPAITSALIPDIIEPENVVYPDFRIKETLFGETGAFAVTGGELVNCGMTGISASNNWAVSGDRSATGKPLFSNDMHLTINSPGIWMQMHQVVPGVLNVTGVLFAGEPFIVAGHNEKIAWGMTNMFVDDVDLYREKINPDNPDQYFFNGEWRNMTLKKEVIKVRGEANDTFIIRSTHRGPIISCEKNTGDEAMSLRWSGLDKSNEIKSVYFLNRSCDWTDFRSALSNFRTINQNFIYADVEGNIGLSSGGGIPLRKYSGTMVRNGETDEYDWTGYLPFEMLPFSYNPEGGSVSSANNKTTGKDYPYYISAIYAAPYRINRIRELLGEKDIFTMDDFRRIINDQHSNCASHLVPYILKLNGGDPAFSEREKEVLSLFEKWDYDMNIDLVTPSVFEFFRLNLLRNALMDELGELYREIPRNIADNFLHFIADEGRNRLIDNINTASTETMDDIVRQSFRDAVREMEKKYGKNISRWKWGNIHKLVLIHPLGTNSFLNMFFRFNSEEYPVGGGDHTINMFCSLRMGFRIDAGPSVKNIFNLSDWDESYTILPTGESGIPGSEFYLSQTKTFLSGGFYKDAFSDSAVRRSARYLLSLNPQK